MSAARASLMKTATETLVSQSPHFVLTKAHINQTISSRFKKQRYGKLMSQFVRRVRKEFGFGVQAASTENSSFHRSLSLPQSELAEG